MNIRILTDSSTDLTSDIRSKIDIVPLTILFGNKEYADGVDIDHETFYNMLVSEKQLPTTSQATPAAFAARYEAAKEAGEELVVITVSSELSGTYQSAIIAAQDYDNVYIVDGRNVAIGTGLLIKEALRLVEEGKSAAETVAYIESIRDKVQLIAMVDTLEYLKRGGRVSRTVAFAGGLLNIKPIICVKNGVLDVIGKARGTKAAFASLVDSAVSAGGVDTTLPFVTGYTGTDDSLTQRFISENHSIFECEAADVPCITVGSAVGTHAGPGAVALAFFAK